MLKKTVAVALTTDMWTSSNNDSYMGITCHFIDSDFQANHRCLEVLHAPDSHTADFIAEELRKVEADFGLDAGRTEPALHHGQWRERQKGNDTAG